MKARRDILRTINQRKANWIGHVLLRKCLLTHVIDEEMEGEEKVEDVSSCQMTLGKGVYTEIKKKQETVDDTVWMTCLEEAMELSRDPLHSNINVYSSVIPGFHVILRHKLNILYFTGNFVTSMTVRVIAARCKPLMFCVEASLDPLLANCICLAFYHL